MRRYAKIEVMSPRAAERVDNLLVFDTRCADAGTRRELLRLLPQLVHLSRALKAHFLEHGCIACQKPDPTIAIAARMRRRGSTWAEIYEITIPNVRSRAERKRFRGAVCWKLEHLDVPARKPSHHYGAGGLCDCCYLGLRRELIEKLRKMHEGRNAAEETAALSRKFDVAQWLLNGDENEKGHPRSEGEGSTIIL